MYGIEVLLEEHRNILKFNDFLRKMCCGIIDGDVVDVRIFRECIEFGRNYADHQHHGKEEKVLFDVMLKQLGSVAEKLIKNGMLVEHDLGRLYLMELENAITRYECSQVTENKMDIIVNAVAYGALLKRHIEKEDSVVYTFAERSLSEETKNLVDETTRRMEEDAENKQIKEKYIHWLASVM